MIHNRITNMYDPETIHLPQPPAPPLNPGAFALMEMPSGCTEQCQMQQWIYQQAYEAAQAVVRPSILERDLLGVWN